jgi:hypothetical protein
LLRRNHPQLAGVVAHVCVDHGAWVERRHLLHLLDEIEKHGTRELARRSVRVAELTEQRRVADQQAWLAYDREVTRRMMLHSMDWFWF